VDRVLAGRLGVGKAAARRKIDVDRKPALPASKPTVCTNQGAVMPSAAANNWLFVIAAPRAGLERPLCQITGTKRVNEPQCRQRAAVRF
jgi:hypothetical protein